MENQNNNPIEGNDVQTKVANLKVDDSLHSIVLKCAIRRRPNMTAIPGQDPNERQYFIGASLDTRTRTNLKGVSGDLEALLMPEIIGRSVTDPTFRVGIDEYWSGISKLVPSDELHQKDHEKGVKIEVAITFIGKARKEAYEKQGSIEEKVEFISRMLTEKLQDGRAKATINEESKADFLLLCYCLRYSRVANNFADVDKSPKIFFYLYEKSSSVKVQLTDIQARQKAMELFIKISEDEKALDAVLLAFDEKPSNYDDISDKVIKVDSLYTVNKESMTKFIDVVGDNNWETKYLINLCLQREKLTRRPNSSAIYYSDTLIGIDMREAADFLDGEKGGDIKRSLEQEINR